MRVRHKDLALIEELLSLLFSFKENKRDKWDALEEDIQEKNSLGTPTEDWIIPPDPHLVFDKLSSDPAYYEQRKKIEEIVPQVLEIAYFLGNRNALHKLEWLNFTTPLLGNACIEDGVDALEELKQQVENSSYFWSNIKNLLLKN